MSTYDSPTTISPREYRGYWQRRLKPPAIDWEAPRLIIRLEPDVPLPYVPEDGPVNPDGYEQVIILSAAARRPAWVDPKTGFFYVNPDEYASHFRAYSREQWGRIFNLSPDEKFSWHTFR